MAQGMLETQEVFWSGTQCDRNVMSKPAYRMINKRGMYRVFVNKRGMYRMFVNKRGMYRVFVNKRGMYRVFVLVAVLIFSYV
jgi:hypothetical protein